MKSLIKITLCVPLIVLALFFALCVTLVPAGASSYKTNINAKGILEATKPFQSFGNFNLGDCQYETAANLILSQWPKSKITTAEVVSAYNTYGSAMNPDNLWAGQDYLISTGFAGHQAKSITPITTKYQIVQAANHGGVEVTNLGPVRMHIFAIISANAKQVTIVDEGFVYRYNWAEFNYDYTQQGETLQFYAVTWAS